MNTAEMAGREFDAEKWNVKLLDAQTRQVGGAAPDAWSIHMSPGSP